jgi:hypothetical protein
MVLHTSCKSFRLLQALLHLVQVHASFNTDEKHQRVDDLGRLVAVILALFQHHV